MANPDDTITNDPDEDQNVKISVEILLGPYQSTF